MLIKIRELKTKKHKIYEYIIISLYLPNQNNKIILIRFKIHIINDLSIKILIDINIIKLKIIVLDTNKDLIIIKSYEFFQISIFIIIKDSYIDVIIINKSRFIILAYSFLIILIK